MSKKIQNSSGPETVRDSALTDANDWADYYSGLDFARLERATKQPCRIDKWLQEKKGKIFELGCGESFVLARSAYLGWEVSGVDFNQKALASLRSFLDSKKYNSGSLINADIFQYDCDHLSETQDILVSFGFLEHFKEPAKILEKWIQVLKPGGLVISIIPNLFSFNAAIFKRFDPDFWDMHIAYSPESLEAFHTSIGLTPLKTADYTGKYNIHMLIPWEKIENKIQNRSIFKTIKYTANYGLGNLLQLLPSHGLRSVNPIIMGVYLKK